MPDTAAEKAVPFPFTIPVTLVDSVIAGVVVLVATEPDRPFAVTTDTLVTVPVTDEEASSDTTPRLFL